MFETAVSRLLRASSEEVRSLVGLVARRWRADGAGGFALAAASATAVAVLAILNHQRGAGALLTNCCAERASLPVPLDLMRLPGSLFAPSPMLPAWGSIVQVLLVVGLAEAAVGRMKTSAVALLGHGVATVAARFFLWLGPGWPLGLAAASRAALDTGPSAATLSVAAYLAVVTRSRVLGVAFVALMVAATVTAPGLAASEHVVALMVGVCCGALHLAVLHWRAQRSSVSDDDLPALAR